MATSQEQVQPYTQKGKASYYSNTLEGQTMTSGDPYVRTAMTAAHKDLPIGTIIKVTNLINNHSVQVEITDRGPHAAGRILDLSRAAAKQLDFISEGEADVLLEVVKPAPGYLLSDSSAHKQ